MLDHSHTRALLDAMEQNAKKVTSPSKGLLQSEDLYQYILETSVYPREPDFLKELRHVTASHPRARMATAPDAGQLMALLLKLANAKKTIELGVFTGYSLLLTALTIPEDGKIIAIDVNRETFEIGLPVIKKAGVADKIDFIESEALPVLDQLLQNPENEGSFDFAFIDADSVNYWNYHERLMKLLKVGGLVVYDNTLWKGTVAMPDALVPEFWKQERELAIELNKSFAADPRIQISHASLGDGITICRRIY
ncbi:probable caffeoyl-CoA O-methyltransferase At4g26220 isoform X1 [Quercus robur]|uniref:probable caffeoyl-CoA O-methyltransferase At4g26220 isoform X1 n=2 Tax=Quercus robur TaxID=38942 RepID=UPI002163F76E|nr:probable caffeoyl-CoA O-methyltransferase At4g26220 isoform X1 [Quercus robur]